MTTAEEITQVLVVDDDDRLRNTSMNLLLKAGFETDVAVDGIEGLEKLKSKDYDVVLLDFQMPELDGIETLKRIKEFRPDAIVIMMTAYASRDNAEEAIALNAYHYVSKPFDLNRAIQLINDAKKAKAAIAEAAVAGAHLVVGGVPEVFDAADSVRNAFFLVNEVNRGDPPVVIVGEPGTGRNRFAEVLHINSVRKAKKLIHFSCRGVDAEQPEARLFGREGAGEGKRREIGALEQSSGGTVLVRDLHEAEPSFAQRLLESLRTGTFSRVDSDKVHKINTRLCLLLPPEADDALDGEGPMGSWARTVEPRRVLLPPLRERRQELPQVLNTLLQRHAEAQGKATEGFAEDALNRLVAYDWPGNLREADNVLDNALLREKGSLITLTSLPSHIAEIASDAEESSYQEAMEAFERNYFIKLMKEHGGDVETVADHANLTVEQLKNKLIELKVEVPE
jgi:DNA-binding NtrC family response regulator